MRQISREGRMRGLMARAALLAAVALAGAAPGAGAQWVRQSEQFYLPASHNWVFREEYPAADRLFNAFDYGHAILYEQLYRNPERAVERLEGREYDFITRKLLVSPPRIPLEERAIEVEYAKMAPEAQLMFEWAHLLHRQLYDVLGDERLTQGEKDAEVARLVAYYRTRPELAFSSTPKNMELMEGQYYSTAFREGFPKFNGLIWGYHWLQVGLYEPLLTGRTVEERQTGVTAAVARFRQMLENAPENMPRVMPMTAAVAPEFARRYPEAAIIFDNLHGMHDVISDILASDSVPRARKRAEILRAAERYRDDTSFVMTEAEWRAMSEMMGVQNMGGPVTGFLAPFPTPTVERGAVMAEMDHAAMGHAAAPAADPDAHAGHAMPAPSPADSAPDALRALHDRLMADPVIHERIRADTATHRLMMEVMGEGGMDHGAMPGAATTEAERARALDFIARMLANPRIEARIHSDPELHRLWSDPEVQRRLRELREGASATPAPPPPPAPAHQH